MGRSADIDAGQRVRVFPPDEFQDWHVICLITGRHGDSSLFREAVIENATCECFCEKENREWQ